MKVIWTETAIEHLTGIYQFIARESPHYAQRTVDRITDRSRQLATFPKSGQMVLDYGRRDIREIIQGSYRIIYRVADANVAVLAIIHAARELPELSAIGGKDG